MASGRVRSWLRQPAARSVAWQAAGSGATLLTAAWIAWRHGVAVQGEYGLLRGWFDAAALAAAAGLPQGVLQLLYRLKVPAAALLPWARRHLIRLSGLCVALALLAWPWGGWPVAALCLSVPPAVAHLLARSWMLHQAGEVDYGLLTALPALCLLGLLAGLSVAGLALHRQLLATALLAATVAAAAISLTRLHRRAGPGAWSAPTAQAGAAAAWSGADLWGPSLHSWWHAALTGLLPAALLSLVATLSPSPDDLGVASLGLHVYQAFGLVAGYVAPILFHRIAGRDRPGVGTVIWPRAVFVSAAPLVLVAVVMAWRQPHSWWPAFTLMALAGAMAVPVRLNVAVLQADNRYRALGWQATWRLGLGLAVAAAASRLVAAPAAVALSLLLVEVLSHQRALALLRGSERA